MSHLERKEFELKAKDKVVQKMTRDGLVDENLADGTTKKARPGDPIHAVSYTHLRAHETGRNLVCRLLLEKKKN